MRLGRQIGRQSMRVNSQSRAVANLTPPHQAAAISRLQTNVDPSSDEYKENQKHMSEVMSRMQELSQKIQRGGPEKADRKTSCRERV